MDAGGWASLREVGSFGLMAFLCAVRRSAMSGKGVEGVGAVVEQGGPPCPEKTTLTGSLRASGHGSLSTHRGVVCLSLGFSAHSQHLPELKHVGKVDSLEFEF